MHIRPELYFPNPLLRLHVSQALQAALLIFCFLAWLPGYVCNSQWRKHQGLMRVTSNRVARNGGSHMTFTWLCWLKWKTQTTMGGVFLSTFYPYLVFLVIYFLGWGNKCWIDSSGDVPAQSPLFPIWFVDPAETD